MKTGKDREDARTTFAATLRDALQRHRKRTGESAKAVCDDLGLGEKGYRWLRKISSGGISHVRTDRREDLKKICDHIGLNHAWLFDVSFARLGKPSTDFAKVVALGIAEAAKRAGTPADSWYANGRKFEIDLEEMASVLLRRFIFEFLREVREEFERETWVERSAEGNKKRDEQALADKPLWDDKTTAYPLMRKEILAYNRPHGRYDETDIDEGTWHYTSVGDGRIEISVEAIDRMYYVSRARGGGDRRGKLFRISRNRWKATMFLNGGWMLYRKGLTYSPIDQPQPNET